MAVSSRREHVVTERTFLVDKAEEQARRILHKKTTVDGARRGRVLPTQDSHKDSLREQRRKRDGRGRGGGAFSYGSTGLKRGKNELRLASTERSLGFAIPVHSLVR